jgi:hypothetical protein
MRYYCVLTAHVEHVISTANATLLHAVQRWYEAYKYYPALVEVEAKLNVAALHDGKYTLCTLS